MIYETHIEIFFELASCWMAFRLNPKTGSISGHFKAHDRQRYHNTASLMKNGERVDDFDEQLSNLIKRSWEKEMMDEALLAIDKLNKFYNMLKKG